MSEKNRVEIHDFKDWKAGVYLIEAGCGQGKNYFVFNTLFPYAHENGKRMLVFSNRVALREQQQAQTQEKDVKLITYQSLEHDEYLETMQDTKNKVRGLMQQVGEYDYIILDEAHYLYQDAPFNKNTETIIELIEKYRSSKIIVLLSATPDLLKKYLRIDKPYFFKADYSYIKEVQYYTKRDTLDEIISKVNYRAKHKSLPCDRPSVNSPNDIAMSAYAKGRMNFEYYMNREYAYSRDKGKCKCCGNAFSPMLQKHCHHVKNKLPLDRINKVPNLVWLCEPCHRMVHNSPIPPELDAKTVGKIMKYREKLKL